MMRAILYGLAVLATYSSTTVHALSIGQSVPAVALPLLTGKTESLDVYRDRVVLVMFWASWCGPCRKEVPALDVLHQRFRGRGFSVVGVTVDRERVQAEEFVRRFNVSYPVAFDPQFAVANEFQADTMPVSYLIKRGGKVIKVFDGYSAQKLPQIEAAVAEALGVVP